MQTALICRLSKKIQTFAYFNTEILALGREKLTHKLNPNSATTQLDRFIKRSHAGLNMKKKKLSL